MSNPKNPKAIDPGIALTDEELHQQLLKTIKLTKGKELFPRKVESAKAFFASGVVMPPAK